MVEGRLSIIVPSHDEAANIVTTVESLLAASTDVDAETIVVDDGSSDRTGELLAPLAEAGRIQLIRHAQRLGRGASIRRGAEAATGDILAFHDADGEYSPQDMYYAVSFIRDGRADAVYGSRTLGPGRSVMQYWRAKAAAMVTMVSNAFTNLNLTDATTSCVVVRTANWRRLVLAADGFDMDVELIAALARSGARIWEVPISYAGRYRADGRKSRRRHTLKRLWRVITTWRRRGTLLREQLQ